MYLIEPCCTQKHWHNLREKIKNGGTLMFHGYGDLSLSELMPVIMIRYSDVDITLVCPALKDTTAECLKRWLTKTWARADGQGDVNAIRHLTVITDLSKKKSPLASTWLKENPFPGRLELHNVQQNDTCLLFPDLALHGPINLVHSGHFTALASTNPKLISSLREVYNTITENRL